MLIFLSVFQQFTLGISSLSKLGPFGAALEVVLILYLTVTSAFGLYSIPCLSAIQPKLKRTPFLHVIINCGLLLILSSALPLLSKILGTFPKFLFNIMPSNKGFWLEPKYWIYFDADLTETFHEGWVLRPKLESEKNKNHREKPKI